ncbi:STAS domain-containing protein [Streptomyces sp. NPDC051133]|uniref:STAS domain-containing protein n=1 Tax=Streptomyces sp. NPDC051133 TaxID=3155521 RepID=UPI00343D6BF1
MEDLTVVTQQHIDRTVVTVSGEMDLETCPALAEATSIIPLTGKTLYLDLSAVSFMDSSGLNLLIQLRHRLHAEGGRLAVTGLQTQPERLLQLTQAGELFTVTAPDAAGRDDVRTA